MVEMMRFNVVLWSVKTAMSNILFFFSELDLYRLPSFDDVKPLFAARFVPFIVALRSASRNYVILYTRAEVFLNLLVDALEGVPR